MNIARKRETNGEEPKLREELFNFSIFNSPFATSFSIIALINIFDAIFKRLGRCYSTTKRIKYNGKFFFHSLLLKLKIFFAGMQDHTRLKKKKKKKIINHANDYILEANCFRLETREIKKKLKKGRTIFFSSSLSASFLLFLFFSFFFSFSSSPRTYYRTDAKKEREK